MKTTLLPALQASVLALSLCAATTPASAQATVGPPAALLPMPKTQGWWQRFHDAAMDRLVCAVLRAAAGATGGRARRPARVRRARGAGGRAAGGLAGAAALPSFAAEPPAGLPGEAGAALTQPLQALRSAHDELALEVEQLQRSQRHFRARHAPALAEEGMPPAADAQALESYAQLLARADAVVSAKARLALAWVHFWVHDHQALDEP